MNNKITININNKGVIDMDTVKGCEHGMRLNSKGCYGNCYAYRAMKRYGYNFNESVKRYVYNKNEFFNNVKKTIFKSGLKFIRIGVMGDPSHYWNHTLGICELLKSFPYYIVIITKHWITLTDCQLDRFNKLENIIFNTSISALDTKKQIKYRLNQYYRIEGTGKSVLRIVSCDFNNDYFNKIQQNLFLNKFVIDNPFRCFKNHKLVVNNIINIIPFGNQYISKFNDKTYTGKCKGCPDMCGVSFFESIEKQFNLFQ